MASAPQPAMLPMLYSQLVPLSSQEHGDWKARQMENFGMLRGVHAVPLTTDEFVAAQRSYPVVFSSGDEPVPLALMGLSDGINMFVGEDGQLEKGAYLPAYVRRYPFLLARLQPESEDLSLCFDPTADLLGAYDDGLALFDDGQPTEAIKNTLAFCEQFELAAQRTTAFVGELKEYGLLTEGEVTIQPADAAQPFVYRGFQIVAEEKLRDLRGDQLRKMSQSGMLPLLHAHLFSLALLRDLFQKQYDAGLAPAQG